MYLKAIEAVGFKSFADKIEVGFNKDITAIVGPNGSGKSNITDAIRWVLGEQSTRYLRASSMQDVIFAGTQTRKSMNMAQVSLIFDNSDASLPMDFSEIEISRRIYRSGEGEYFINKKSCRLKDIYNLFMDTGVGKGSLFVIGQNKVDEILNGRAEEKRVLVEDLAGIVRYKQRKQESMQRLEKIQENLLRISDIKIELENNIGQLQIEADKTKEYNALFQQYRVHNLIVAAHSYRVCATQAEQAEEKIQEYLQIQQEQQSELESLELLQTRNNQDVEEIQAEYAQVNNQLLELVTKREQVAGNILLLNEKAEQLQRQQAELLASKDKFLGICANYEQKIIVDLQTQQEQQEYARSDLKRIHTQLQSEYEGIVCEHTQVAQEHLQLQEKVNINLNSFMDNKNKVLYIERNLQQIAARIVNKEELKAEQLCKVELLNKQIEDLVTAEATTIATNKNITEELSSQETKKTGIKKQIEQQQHLIDEMDVALSKLNNETIVLERLRASYQGFGVGIKNVLTAREDWKNGVIGAVAELLTVPKEYITAIETALGGSAQNIVTEDEETAKQAVNYLKRGKLGRATFLPKTTIRAYGNDQLSKMQEIGVIGTAAELVKIQDGLEEILKFLLGRIIVVDSMEHALQVARKYNYKYRFVTLDGEVVNIGGSLTGGVNDKVQPGFLAREEEIKNNKKKIEQMQDARYELSMAENSLSEQIRNIDAAILQSREELQANQIALMSLSAQTKHLQESLQQQLEGIENTEREIIAQRAESLRMQADKQATEQLVQALQADKDAHSQDIQTLFDKVQKLQEDKENKNNQVNQAYNKLSSMEQSLKYTAERLAEAQENLARTRQEVEEINLKYDTNLAQSQQTEQEAVLAKQMEQELSVNRQELNQQLVQTTQKREGILSTQREIQGKLKDRNSIQNANERALSRAHSTLKERQLQMENLLQSIAEKYEATMEEAQACYTEDVDIKQVRTMVEEMKSKIQELGLINPKAIQDYEQALEKVEFLSKQYADLNVAKEDLDKVIEDINKSMTVRFKEAFNSLNEHFDSTYKKLFGGGEARLQLVDENDWLNSGVDIFVRPHGKKVLSMNALSGGERSLTVIALLFAILSMKKTAFCVLDEIDAPLDEANLHRFKEFLLQYGEQTQFIMVTHRKPSMQIANNLYGVTMQEAGVSKILSVHLKDVEEE